MTKNEKLDKLSSLYGSHTMSAGNCAVIEEFSHDSDADIRQQTVYAVANVKTEKSLEILLLLAKDENIIVRCEALNALGNFHDERTAEFLKKALNREKNDLTYFAAAIAFVDVTKSIEKYSLSDIKKIFGPPADKEDSRTLCAYYALCVFGDESALGKILSYLKSEDGKLRCTTLAVIEKLKNETNKEEICKKVSEVINIEKVPIIFEKAQSVLNK